eukprot:757037-Hanusia_phi.AAC.2
MHNLPRALSVAVAFALFVITMLYIPVSAAPAIASFLMNEGSFDAVQSGLYRNVHTHPRQYPPRPTPDPSLQREGEAAVDGPEDRVEVGPSHLDRREVACAVEVLVHVIPAEVRRGLAKAAVEGGEPEVDQEQDEQADRHHHHRQRDHVGVHQGPPHPAVHREQGVGQEQDEDHEHHEEERRPQRDPGVRRKPGVPQEAHVGDHHLDVQQEDAQEDEEAVDGEAGPVLGVDPSVMEHHGVDLPVVEEHQAEDEEHQAHPHGLEDPLEGGVKADGVEAHQYGGEEEDLRVEDDVDDPVKAVVIVIVAIICDEATLTVDGLDQVDGLEEVTQAVPLYLPLSVRVGAVHASDLLADGEEDEHERVDDIVARDHGGVDLQHRGEEHVGEDEDLPQHVQHPLIPLVLPGAEQQVPTGVQPEAHHAHEERVPGGGEGEARGVVAVDGHLLAALLPADADQAGLVGGREVGLVVLVCAAVVGEVGVDGGQAVVEGDRERGDGHVASAGRGDDVRGPDERHVLTAHRVAIDADVAGPEDGHGDEGFRGRAGVHHKEEP